MSKYIKIDTSSLVLFLNYLLEHIEECYHQECETMIIRFLKRNGVNEYE